MNILRMTSFNFVAILFIWSLGATVFALGCFKPIGFIFALIAYISYKIGFALYYNGKKRVRRLYIIYEYLYKKNSENN